MDLYAYSGLINGVGATVFGLIVFFHNQKNLTYRLFLFMNLIIAAWSYSYWLWLQSETYENALFLARILSLAAAFIPVSYFHWLISLLKHEDKYRIVLWLSYGLTIVLCFLSFSPLYVQDVRPILGFEFWPKAGPLYVSYICLYLLLVAVSAYELGHHIKKEGRKLGPVLLGSLLGFVGGFTNFPLWYDIPLLPVGNYFVMAYVGLFAYGMIKNRLMNFKGILTELAASLVLGASIIQFLSSDHLWEYLLRFVVVLISVFGGYILIKSVFEEIERRQEIQKLAVELQRTNEHLKELDRTKTEFVSIASHELLTPTAAIKGYLSMILEDGMGKVDTTAKGYLIKVYNSTERLASLVEDLLNVSRIESGRLKTNIHNFSLIDSAQKAVDELSVNAKKKGLQITFIAPRSGIKEVYGDPDHIYRVLINLIGNAIKYTPTGWVKCFVTMHGARFVQFSVSDSGLGIPKELLPHLFEKFYRADRKEIAGIQGTGLGLYVSKRIVEMMGGQMTVESEVGKGSVFHFTLPVYTGQKPTQTPEPQHLTPVKNALESTVHEKQEIKEEKEEDIHAK